MTIGEGQSLGCPWQCLCRRGRGLTMPTGLWVVWGRAPDDAWVLPPVPRGPAPLLNHHHGLPVGKEAAEEKDERGREQQAQAVEGVVVRQAGAVEVEGGVQLDSDHGQQQADAVHHRLGAGLEVLEEHAELLHGSRRVGAGSEASATLLASPGGESDPQEVLLFPEPPALHEGSDAQRWSPGPLPSSLGSESLLCDQPAQSTSRQMCPALSPHPSPARSLLQGVDTDAWQLAGCPVRSGKFWVW